MGKLVEGMEHLPSGVMELEGVGCVPDGNWILQGLSEFIVGASGAFEMGGQQGKGSHQWVFCAQAQ